VVKAPVFCKLASGEPLFAVLYHDSLAELCPPLADCVALAYWPGGSGGLEEVLFEACDAVILYGGLRSLATLRQAIPAGRRVIEHGHKLGFGYIGAECLGRAGLDDLLERVSYDVAMFDQQACLAPHCYYLERGGEVAPREFAEALSAAMERQRERLPRGEVQLGEAAAVTRLRAAAEYYTLLDGRAQAFPAAGPADFTVLYEDDPAFVVSPLNRVLYVKPVSSLDEVCQRLSSFGELLQNAAVAVGDDRAGEVWERLARLGVSRICSPGRMPRPSMIWKHDGRSCLAELCRFTDVEHLDWPDKGGSNVA
jgi:hypothetical protein